MRAGLSPARGRGEAGAPGLVALGLVALAAGAGGCVAATPGSTSAPPGGDPGAGSSPPPARHVTEVPEPVGGGITDGSVEIPRGVGPITGGTGAGGSGGAPVAGDGAAPRPPADAAPPPDGARGSCSLLRQDCPLRSQGCYRGAGGTSGVCATAGAVGSSGPCVADQQCDRGLVCVAQDDFAGLCRPVCDLAAPVCPGRDRCRPLAGAPAVGYCAP